jgi:hypothetical protein
VGGTSFFSRSSSSRSYLTQRTSSPGFSYSVTYYAPSPFRFSSGEGGLFVGLDVGIRVGATLSFFFILMGFATFVLVSGFVSDQCAQASGIVEIGSFPY